MDTFASNICSFVILSWLLCHVTFAQLLGQEGAQEPFGVERQMTFQGQQCRFERLSSLEPLRRVQSEAGFTEYFGQPDQQLQCIGVAIQRRTVEPRGLVLPSYSNTPRLIYVIQGRGIAGSIFPGCPESYQSFRQSEEQLGEEFAQRPRTRDEHQKVYQVNQGDVIAVPAGVTHWFYNDGDSPVVAIIAHNINSNANQLEPRQREFLLAGRKPGSQQSTRPEEVVQGGSNILSGFSLELLSEALGIDRELARRIQNQQQQGGEIVRVRKGLKVTSPLRGEQTSESEETTSEQAGRGSCQSNGLEENYCFMKQRENIERASLADVYNPRGGRINSVDSQKLPILRFIQMSLKRGVLHQNAINAPHWTMNAHSAMYVLRGSCRCQVVGHQGRNVFDGELRQGQLLVIPQNFVIIRQATSDRCEWISFKTNHLAMANHIVGKTSNLRAMPLDVIANSYGISREEARALKFNRGNEVSIFIPRVEGRERA